MAYEHHCIKLIDIGEYESMYKTSIPLELNVLVNKLNDFIMNSTESTIYDHEEGSKHFKMDVLWIFRDDGLSNGPMTTNKNWIIASNFEDGMPAWVLNDDKRWYMRMPMSEHGDILKLKYDWINVYHEIKCMLTG